MNIRNIFLIVVQLFLLLLTSICVVFCETRHTLVKKSGVVSKQGADMITQYCLGEKLELDPKLGFERLKVFYKDGTLFTTLKDMHNWDIEQEERDKRTDILKERSHFFNQLRLRNVVGCEIWQRHFDRQGKEELLLIKGLVMGTADISACEHVSDIIYQEFKEYFEQEK